MLEFTCLAILLIECSYICICVHRNNWSIVPLHDDELQAIRKCEL